MAFGFYLFVVVKGLNFSWQRTLQEVNKFSSSWAEMFLVSMNHLVVVLRFNLCKRGQMDRFVSYGRL